LVQAVAVARLRRLALRRALDELQRRLVDFEQPELPQSLAAGVLASEEVDAFVGQQTALLMGRLL